MKILSKDEFREKFLDDIERRKHLQAKKKRDKKKVKIGMPFKEEVYIDTADIIKKLYPDAIVTKDKELIIKSEEGLFHLKVTEKKKKIEEETSLKNEKFKTPVYEAILKYYNDTERQRAFFSKEGVVIRKGTDFTVKITKKKQ